MKRLLLIAAWMFFPLGVLAEDSALPAFKDIDSLEARVQGCVTCHGQSGQGTGNDRFPRIAGKPADYLYNQLAAFRDGTRSYTPMNYLVSYLPDPYLHEMAEYFARLRPAFAPVKAATAARATLERGRVLATAGDAGAIVPACQACHGKALTGMEPGIPGLLGLSATYIEAQLTSWRTGARHALEPDCMKRVAVRMSDKDVAAVAAWLASQAPPADASPDSTNLVRMPLACGSQK
jgi:cytochrome c553